MEINKEFKILTYNIHGGSGIYFKKDTTESLIEIIKESKSDIICLQEFWKLKKTSKHHIQETLKYYWPYFTFGENSFFPKYSQGNVILSRFDIVNNHNYLLNSSSKEQRGLLWTKLLTNDNQGLDIFCVHLSNNYKDNLNELNDCIEIIKKHNSKRFILAGDFNDWKNRHTNILKEQLDIQEIGINHYGKHIKTFPAVLPILSLDRIYFNGVNSIDVPRSLNRIGPSDHRSILGHFTL